MFGKVRYINLNEEGKEPWKFDGSKINFLDTVLWVMVFREAYKNNDDLGSIVNNERKTEEYGLAHNITDEAVISEMLRLGAELQQIIDEHKEKGITTEYDL